MILLSQQGLAAADIAGLLGYDPSTVRRWIHRYREHGATGLADRSRSGRPRLGSPRLHQRIRRLLAEPKAWTIGRLWKRLGRPAISVRTLHRRVREVACWRRPGRQHGPQLPGRAPEPADPPVCLALVRQGREQVRPIPGRLGQEPGLAAPAWQMPHQRNRQQLGVTAGRRRTGRDPMAMAPELIASSASTYTQANRSSAGSRGNGRCGQGSWTTGCLSQRPLHDQDYAGISPHNSPWVFAVAQHGWQAAFTAQRSSAAGRRSWLSRKAAMQEPAMPSSQCASRAPG